MSNETRVMWNGTVRALPFENDSRPRGSRVAMLSR